MRKVDAVAALQAELAPDMAVHAIAHDVEHHAAVAALRACDVIVTAPDRGQPRVLAGLCAAAYGRVHLDIGAGVFRHEGVLDCGADIRLILPGHCLLCVGGVDLDAPQVADWRRQRAGSLRSLNGMATSYALFLLERLLAGDISATTWTRLRLDGRAQLTTEQPAFAARTGCSLCAEAGRGDAVWRAAARAG
jgi:molybdopterin/thiamine biosynthesis adenylyltransferase